MHESPAQLKKYSGSHKKWAESFFKIYGYVMQKSTKAAEKLPSDLKLAKDDKKEITVLLTISAAGTLLRTSTR